MSNIDQLASKALATVAADAPLDASVVLSADIAPRALDVPPDKQWPALPNDLVCHDGFLWRPRGEDQFDLVSAAVEVVAIVHDVTNGSHGRLVGFKTRENQWKQVLIPDADFHQSASAVCAMLASKGLYIRRGGQLLLGHLLHQNPPMRLLLAQRPGWYEVADQYLYVLASGTAGPPELAGHFGLDPLARAARCAVGAGEWREKVASLCVGNTRAAFVVSYAFASILLPHSGLGSGGVNLVGDTSSGKSTLLQMAASVFGPPDYVQQWRATSNGLEHTAAAHNHGLLILDELAQVDPRDVGATIYMIGNGVGKVRASRSGHAVPPQTWLLLLLSAGEITLAEHMAEAGKQPKGGQGVRMLDIEAAPLGGYGVYETLHGFDSGAELSKTITDRVSRIYGRAGLVFARYLAERPELLRSGVRARLKAVATEFARQAHEHGTGALLRVIDRFALTAVAGELATEAGITGWPAGEATRAAAACLQSWLTSRPHSEESPHDPVEAVRSFICQHRLRFQDASKFDSSPVRNQAGWVTPPGKLSAGDDAGEFHFIDEVFRKEVLRGFPSLRTACRTLAVAGYLKFAVEDGQTRYKIKRGGHDGAGRLYVVSERIVQSGDRDTEEFPAPSRRSE